MQTRCAWCDAILVVGKEGEGISHGICPHCAKKLTCEHDWEALQGYGQGLICTHCKTYFATVEEAGYDSAEDPRLEDEEARRLRRY